MKVHVVQPNQSGFSAVELLITIFIGVLFILAGVQLHISILGHTKDQTDQMDMTNYARYSVRQWVNGNAPNGLSLASVGINISNCQDPTAGFNFPSTIPNRGWSSSFYWDCPDTELSSLRYMRYVLTNANGVSGGYATYFTYE